VISEFTDNELEALYKVFTDLCLVGQWRLIHDVERALESRGEPSGDPNKATRKFAFRKKWTRVNLTVPAVGAKRRKR